MSFSFTPTGIRQSSAYNVQFSGSSAIPADSLIKITLPSDCSIASSSSYSCSYANAYTTPTSTVYCVSDSSTLTVTVYNFFSGGDVPAGNSFFPYSITLNVVTNPISTKTTNPIGVSTTSSSGTVIDSDSGNSAMSITAVAAVIASASITSSTQIVGSTATFTFTYTPTYVSPSGCVIQILFPYWNSIMSPSTSALVQMISGTPTCIGTVNIATSLTCTYSTSTMLLKVSNGFSANASGAVSFTVATVLNPPNQYSITGFVIYLRDSSDNNYEYSSSLSIQVTSPNAITISSGNISATTKTVSTSTSMDVSFTIKNPMAAGYLIYITMPPELSFDSSMTVIGKNAVQLTTLSRTISGSVIQITNGYVAYSSTTFVWVQLTSITTPSSTKTTSMFTVTTLTPDGKYIDTATGGTFTATAGTITKNGSNSYITTLSSVVGVSTTYYVEFLIPHSLPSNAAVVVVFPSKIVPTARSATTCTSAITNVNAAAQCAVVSQTLTVTAGFPSGLTSNSAIKFGINLVTNPGSTAPSTTFTITTYTDSTVLYSIDTIATGVTFTCIAASLASVVVTPSSDITGDITVYDFKITTTNAVSTSGYLVVLFPTGVSISSTSTAQSNCIKIAGFNSNQFNCVATTSSITINNAFDSGSFAAGLLEFTLGSMINPSSTKSVQSFTATTYDSSAYTIDTLSTNIAVKVNTPNTLTSASASMASLVNGALTTYTFTITPKNTTPSGSYITIIPPSVVTFPSVPTCTSTSSLITAISCTIISSTNLQATLTMSSSATSSNALSFTVSNVKNPPSTLPSTTFLIYTFTSDSYGIDKKESGIAVTTTTAGTITNMIITAGDTKIAAATAYTINYVPINVHPVGTIVTIVIPSAFTLGTISCSSTVLVISCVLSGNSVVVSGFDVSISSTANVIITVSGITNPTTMVTTGVWTVSSTTGNYLIDKSSSVTSTFTCSTPCLTCSGLPSTCTSCSTTGSTPYLYSSTCNAACLDGYVDDTGTADIVCVACNSLCKTCTGTTTYCTSCYSGSYPYLYSNTCNALCLDAYYGDGTTCYPCVNPCLKCSSSTACLSCTIKNTSPDFGSSTYLYGTECLVTCPSGYLPNSSTLTCDTCSSNCLTCSSTSTFCLSCSSPLLLKDNACVTTCPADGTYIVTSTTCTACVSPCSTCTTTTSTCTACVTGYLLSGSSCVTSCSSGTVNISGVCTACASPCKTCSTSTLICSSCVSGYLLYSTTCVTTCPNGYVSDGVNCVVCSSTCFTCTLAADLCTSCTNGLSLLNYVCQSSCPADTYISIANVCQPCNSNCATCSSTTTYCKSCYSGYKLYNNACISSCPTGTTIDTGSACSDCSTNCATCSGTISTCLTCKTGFYLANSICVDSCAGGYILISSVCTACNSVCVTCSGTTTYCTSCITNYYLYNNFCVAACPNNYVIVAGACVEVVATDCNSGCTAALLANTACDTACNIAACQYDNGLCIGPTSCLDGQYLVDSTCYECADPCNKCTAPASCLTCMVDSTTGAQWLFRAYNSFCYSACPSGTYQNGLSCEECNIACSSCSGASTTCTACPTGYFLYNNQCLLSCIAYTTIESGTSCVDCNSNCKYCSGTTTTCTSCATDKVLQGTVCQVSCNSGYTVTTTSTTTCLACVGCLTCSGSTTYCLTCDPSLFFYNNLCVSSCPSGTYSSGAICITCDSSCVTCTASGSCTTCISGYVMYGALCLSACPSGYENTNGACTVIVPSPDCTTGCTSSLLNNALCDTICNVEVCNYDNTYCNPPSDECPAGQYFSGSSCTNCVYPCLTCVSSATCSSCAVSTNTGATMFLYLNSCYDACPSGTYQSGILCYACDSTCLECNLASTTCISCASGKFLYFGICVSTCPLESTVAVGTVCDVCSTNCASCVTTISTCTACPSGKVLMSSSCKSSCDAGYTVTSAYPNTCQICTNSCLSCLGETYTCTSCASDKYLYLSQCLSSCPTLTTVPSGGTCVACTSPCAQCSVLSTTCTLCNSGYSLSSSTCVTSCPSGYESLNGVCTILCSDSCTSANLLDTVCQTQCNTTPCNKDNGYCVTATVCDTYQYQDGSSCIDCTYPCNTCTSGTYCLSCKVSTITLKQLYFYSGACYDTCPTGTYLSGIVCLACTSPCASCSTNATYCNTCTNSLKLYNGACVVSCPVGTTLEVSNICYDCSNICATCSGNINTCTSCPSGTVLSQGTCVTTCPAGQTTTTTSAGACVSCSSTCETCLGATTYCTSCVGSFLYSNTCITTCPSGYTDTLADPTICTACLSSCLECDETVSKCTACYSGYSLTSAYTCQLSTTAACPDGYTTTSTSGTSCILCESPCVKCSGETTYCLTCVSPLVPSSGVCVTCTSPCQTCTTLPTLCNSCVEGYYLSGTSCLACNSLCVTCSGTSSTCTSCTTGYYLSGSTCIKCVSTCLTCTTNASTCTSCSSGLFLENSACVGCSSNCLTCESTSTKCTSCSSSYYLTSSNTCAICSSSCLTCISSSTFCTSCASGMILLSNACGVCSSSCSTCVTDFNTCASCSSSKYLSSGACLACDSLCKTCTGSSSYCTSCNTPYNLFGSVCSLCDVSCATCSGAATTCLTCIAPLTLIGTSCLLCTNDCKTCAGTTGTCITCSSGYYLSGTSCLSCDPNCLTCSGISTNCITCPIDSTLAAGTCYYACADGYVLIGSTCVLCDSNCQTCAGTATSCTSCYIGFVYESACISNCPTGYYDTGTTCSICSTLCKTCYDTPNTCLSCNTGYSLTGTSCISICSQGEFYSDNLCYTCESNCLTCVTSATNCLSCNNADEVVNSDGVCAVPCPDGFLRNTNTGNCDACDSTCTTCEGTTGYCTTCSSNSTFLYNGGCLSSCPSLTTVESGSKCVDCVSPCQTCEGTQYTCTSCIAGKYFYFNSCVTTCPSGYEVTDKSCAECAKADCSNSTSSNSTSSSNSTGSSNTTNNDTTPTYDSLTADPVPFPFSGVTAGSAAVIGVTKLTAVGVNFVPSLISVWGITAAGSWIFLGSYLPNEGDTQHSRRLNMLDPTSGNLILSIVLLIIIIALAFHFLCNFLYTTSFLCKTWNKDDKFKKWRKKHKCATGIVTTLSYLVSFHCIRFMYCSMCNQRCFKAKFECKGNLTKPLVKYGYVSLLCTNLPMIAADILILNHFEKGYWIWMFALDSLVITVLLTFLIFCDIKTLEKELLRSELEKELGPFDEEGEILADPLKDLIDHFPSIDLSGMVPVALPRPKLRKRISKSIENVNVLLPKLKRAHSFPLVDFEGIEVNPGEFRVHSEVALPDEPYAEEILEMKEISFIEEPTIIQEDEPARQGELYNSSVEYKIPMFKLDHQVFTPMNLDPRTEEFTEIIAFTEEDSVESEKSKFSESEDVKEESFSLHEQEPNMEDIEIIQDMESTIKPDSNSSEHLGTIEEENELELEKAIADIENPEIVSVPHIETGRRVKIQKNFKGAKMVDLENKVIESMAPVDEEHFDLPKTIVDEGDVRFATMLSKKGDKVRVKRNFKGARILDLEKRVSEPNGFLIGKSVENEQEFKFQAAYPDPEDPEVVVVTHKETGEDVKVRKTFQDACVVDEKGHPVPLARLIDRSDYDIPKTIIDKEDVHIATLSHKVTRARVRVRRDFKGAKIVDLEKKTDANEKPQRKYTEKSEPEPLSPDLSDLEFIPFPEEDEEEWEMPKHKEKKWEIPKNPQRPKMSAGRERLADLAKIISEESKGIHSPVQDVYDYPIFDSDEDLDYMPEPEVPHYRDLDEDFDTEINSRAESILEDSESYSNLRGFGKKKKRKVNKKFRPADAFRMKGLEEIYLERQGIKKKPAKNRFSDDILEPDMEIDDISDFGYDPYRGGPLDRAGEEIVKGRTRK